MHHIEVLPVNEMNAFKKIAVFLFQFWVWLGFFPLLVVATAFFALLALILIPFVGASKTSRICGVSWSQFICLTTPVWVRVRGRENVDSNQSYIIIANHQSQYDIVALYGWLGIDFRWVMKKELRKVPGLGIACEKLGHVFVDRSNTKRAMQSLHTAKKMITRGVSIIFFPEGTRSESGELRRFKKGAFKMATELDLPLLPITITGTRERLRAKSLVVTPGPVQITIHTPIPVEGRTDRELMTRAQSIMQEALLRSK